MAAGVDARARSEFRRSVATSTLRVVVALTLLGLLYAYAPLGQHLSGNVAAELAFSLLLLLVVTVWEFRNVSRTSNPEVRALEAVGVLLPLVLLPFASAYYVMSHEVHASFGTVLTRLDALYFTITTFATVGYGDITAKSEPARAVVTVQMVIDLMLIGIIAKALFGAAQRRRSTLSERQGEGDAAR
ncbi:MAG TPA: potassium channel family protein [Jatrophihabitans sp.]|jgi:voltage-gated potassium channel Kch